MPRKRISKAQLNRAFADVIGCQPRTVERWWYQEPGERGDPRGPNVLALAMMKALFDGDGQAEFTLDGENHLLRVKLELQSKPGSET